MKTSSSWLFSERYVLFRKQISGEDGALISSHEWQRKILKILEKYPRKYSFNADEIPFRSASIINRTMAMNVKNLKVRKKKSKHDSQFCSAAMPPTHAKKDKTI